MRLTTKQRTLPTSLHVFLTPLNHPFSSHIFSFFLSQCQFSSFIFSWMFYYFSLPFHRHFFIHLARLVTSLSFLSFYHILITSHNQYISAIFSRLHHYHFPSRSYINTFHSHSSLLMSKNISRFLFLVFITVLFCTSLFFKYHKF